MGVCVPEEYGGAGADFVSYVLVLEELSRADAGVGVTVAVHTSAVTLPILALRHRRAAGAVRAAARARRTARRVRADRAGGGLGRGFAAHVRRRRRTAGGMSTARSGSSRPRGTPARSSSSRAPTRRPQGAPGVSAFVLDADHVRVTRDEEKLGLNSSTTSDLVVDAHVDARPAARTRRARASTSRWRRSTAAGSGSPRRPSGSPGRRSRRPATTRSSASSSASRSASSRRSSTSSPTCRRRSTPRACSSTAPRG